MNIPEFGKWAKAERKRRKWTQREVARRSDLSERRYGDIERGQAENVTSDTLEAIRKAFQETEGIANGESSRNEESPSSNEKREGVNQNLKIHRFEARKVGDRAEAGAGADNSHPDNEDVEVIVREEAEIFRLTGLRGSQLKAFFVVGNSMLPDIAPNTAALYLPLSKIDGSGLYVITLEGLTVVKVVEVMAGGALKLSSKNKVDYPDPEILLPLKDADGENWYRSEQTGLSCKVKVEGRVVMYTKAT